MKSTTNYESKQRQTKRGITLVTFMGGTIWGHHSDKGTKPTICISDFFTLLYYIWPKNLKSATGEHKFRTPGPQCLRPCIFWCICPCYGYAKIPYANSPYALIPYAHIPYADFPLCPNSNMPQILLPRNHRATKTLPMFLDPWTVIYSRTFNLS